MWLQDEQVRSLIQKRGNNLKFQPGIWAFTGGSALAGESGLEATRRETREDFKYPEEILKLAGDGLFYQYLDVYFMLLKPLLLDPGSVSSQFSLFKIYHLDLLKN